MLPRFPHDGAVDAAMAIVTVHHWDDPVAGLRQMARVTRPGGVVAACVWDHGGGQGPLSVFWEAARELDPDVEDESDLPGAAEGSLAELFRAAGLSQIEDAVLSVTVAHPTFDEPYKQELVGLTEKFVSRGASPNRINGSAISQVRANESAFNWIWQLREFHLDRFDHPELGRPCRVVRSIHFLFDEMHVF